MRARWLLAQPGPGLGFPASSGGAPRGQTWASERVSGPIVQLLVDHRGMCLRGNSPYGPHCGDPCNIRIITT